MKPTAVKKRKRPRPNLSVDVSSSSSRSKRSASSLSSVPSAQHGSRTAAVASSANATAHASSKPAPILNASAPFAWWKQGLVPVGAVPGQQHAPALCVASVSTASAGISDGGGRGLLAAPPGQATTHSHYVGHTSAAADATNRAVGVGMGLPMAKGHLGALPLAPPSAYPPPPGHAADTPRSRLFAVFGRPAAVASTGSVSDSADAPPLPAVPLGASLGGAAASAPVQGALPDTPGSASSTVAFPPLSHRAGGAGGAAAGGAPPPEKPAHFGLAASPRGPMWHPNMRSQIVRNNPYGRSGRPLFAYAACSRPGGARGGDAGANEDRYTAVADALRVGARVAAWNTDASESAGQCSSSQCVPTADAGSSQPPEATGLHSSHGTLPCSSLYGVMDGHGGGRVASIVADSLFEALARMWPTTPAPLPPAAVHGSSTAPPAAAATWQSCAEHAFHSACAALQQDMQLLSSGKGGEGGSSEPPATAGVADTSASGSHLSKDVHGGVPISNLDGSTVLAALVVKLPEHPAVPPVPASSATQHTAGAEYSKSHNAHGPSAPATSAMHSPQPPCTAFGVSIAHLGDSAAMLLCADGSYALLTAPHAAWRADERARLEGEQCSVNDGRVGGVIDMTRSLGDSKLGTALPSVPELVHFHFQIPQQARADELYSTTQLAAGTCSTDESEHTLEGRAPVTLALPAPPLFLVLASDGFWEKVPPEHTAHILMGMSPGRKSQPRDGGEGGGAAAQQGWLRIWLPAALQAKFRSAPKTHWARHYHGRIHPTRVESGANSPCSVPGAAPVALHARVLTERCVAEALCRGARDDVTALVVDLRNTQE